MKLFHPAERQSMVRVVLITGSCCMPGLAPIEHQIRQILDQLIAETNIPAQVSTIPVIQAIHGGVPKDLLNAGRTLVQQENRLPLPAVLVNGKLISHGFPDQDAIRSALLNEFGVIQSKEH